MSTTRFDHAEIVRSAAADMPVAARIELLAELMTSTSHPAALRPLIAARNALTLHIDELLSDQFERESL